MSLNEQVKRNIDRFPDTFMFQLTKPEFDNLKPQFATSSSAPFVYYGLVWDNVLGS